MTLHARQSLVILAWCRSCAPSVLQDLHFATMDGVKCGCYLLGTFRTCILVHMSRLRHVHARRLQLVPCVSRTIPLTSCHLDSRHDLADRSAIDQPVIMASHANTYWRLITDTQAWSLESRRGFTVEEKWKRMDAASERLEQLKYPVPANATLGRLLDLLRRALRGNVPYASCSLDELQIFMQQRSMKVPSGKLLTHARLIRALEKADDVQTFEKMLDLPPELRVLSSRPTLKTYGKSSQRSRRSRSVMHSRQLPWSRAFSAKRASDCSTMSPTSFCATVTTRELARGRASKSNPCLRQLQIWHGARLSIASSSCTFWYRAPIAQASMSVDGVSRSVCCS